MMAQPGTSFWTFMFSSLIRALFIIKATPVVPLGLFGL